MAVSSTLLPHPGRIQNNLLNPITAGFLAFSIIAAFGFQPTGNWQYLPFAISMILFGLPHGAADHLVGPRLRGSRINLVRMGLFFAGYIALALVYGVFWLWTPAAAALAFVLMTWFHWGQGELFALQRFNRSDYVKSTPHQALAVLIRGALPMVVPFLAFPAIYRDFVRAFVGLITDDPARLDTINKILGDGIRLPIAIGLLVLAGIYFAWGWRNAVKTNSTIAWGMDFLEVATLAFFFLRVTPILAVGLYFSFWHAIRHLIRLSLLDQTGEAAWDAWDLGRVAWRLIQDTAPLTILSLLMLVGLYFVVPIQPDTVAESTAFYLAFIAMLTLPHTAVVIWMDARQKVWGKPPYGGIANSSERTAQ